MICDGYLEGGHPLLKWEDDLHESTGRRKGTDIVRAGLGCIREKLWKKKIK